MDKFINYHFNMDDEIIETYRLLNDINYSYKKPKFPYNIIKSDKELTYKNLSQQINSHKSKSGGGNSDNNDSVYVFLF